MPITKSYRRYRRQRRKSNLMGGIRRSYTGARRVPMTTGKVKRIIDAELKVRDLSVGPVAIPTLTGAFVHITAIGQGDANTERSGNWIKPTTWMGTVTV